MDAPDPHVPVANDPRRTELLLDALKAAVAVPGEHRLFRAGKLPGLFPSRAGTSAAAALFALSDGLLESVRTETKGKVVTEWVKGTPRSVAFVHDHDSPKSVLKELREVLRATRAGVPEWLAEVKIELTLLSDRFTETAAAMQKRLDDLAERVEAALRRAEAGGPSVAESVGRVVPWAVEALEYLDRRRTGGAAGDCPISELFHAVRVKFPSVGLASFHDGLQRLHDVRAVRLSAGDGPILEPEYAVVADGRLADRAGR